MWTTIECAGHPRDMGLAQGAAAGHAIRAEVKRIGLARSRSRIPSLRSLVTGPLRGHGAGREFFRHFAHLAERLDGLATAANVPTDSVLDLHLRLRAGGNMGGLLSRRASVRAQTSGAAEAKRAVLERTLPAAASDECDWIVRESRPAVGFASIEVSLPWLVTAVAGINVGGLAVVAGPLLWGTPGRAGDSPSPLLVQECLQRFGDVSGALDWCRKRPVQGEQSFVLADASGAVASVVVSGRTRRAQLGEGELYLEGGEPPGAGEDEDQACAAEATPDRVVLDPMTRRLELEAAGARFEIGLTD